MRMHLWKNIRLKHINIIIANSILLGTITTLEGVATNDFKCGISL